jgi:hypothetical protein
MFLRLLPALAIAVTAFPAISEEKLPCEVTPDETSCSLNFACLGDQGRWYQGRAIGRGTGVLDGVTSDGAKCSGTWTNSNAASVGQADFSCDDGTTGTAYYFLQDGYTGTAIGRGMTGKDEPIQAWSREHVIEFLKKGSLDGQARLQCGEYSIPIS